MGDRLSDRPDKVDVGSGISLGSEFWITGRQNQGPYRAHGSASELDRGSGAEGFESRLRLVTRQLARFAYMAGESFTAADISVAYALMLARRGECATLGAAEEDYMIRVTERDALKRALETCQATKDGYKGFG